MPDYSICAVFGIKPGNFFFAVYVLLIVNLHAAAGTTR